MQHESIWQKTAAVPPVRPSLSGNLETGVAVVGGGLAGILTAHFLRQRGRRVVVLEAGRMGSGQTGRTTAKITAQHDLIYRRLIDEFGTEKARQYAQANRDALESYAALVGQMGLDCDFMRLPAYLYSTSDTTALERECDAAVRLGFQASLTRITDLPFPIKVALKFQDQACFHPLKFLYPLAQPLEVYENTPVLEVDGTQLRTPGGTVRAEQVVFACHYPFVNVPGYYFMRMHQERSYVLALEHAQSLNGEFLSVDENGLSLRPYGSLLLLGGGNHRTGENSGGGKYEFLRREAARWWPNAIERAAWSAQDCMPLDGVPYIGPFSASTPNWYVATGFQKWGMTSSMVAAKLISAQISGEESPWAEVFSPQRFTPGPSAKTFLEEAGHAAGGLTRRVFTPPRAEIDQLPNGHGGVVDCDGEKVGVYKAEDGEVFLVSIKCPHLGCQLEWNPDEKSWDCPCHGSRFDIRGALLDGPAQQDIAD